MPDQRELQWELRALGSFEEVSRFITEQSRAHTRIAGLAAPYDASDVAPFSPTAAVYFMNGYSAAKVRLLQSNEELEFEWFDKNTSIAASTPKVYQAELVQRGLYVPVPKPLAPTARFPSGIPDSYRRETTVHLLQVLSMDMRSRDGSSRLLIGLPYAEEHSGLFFSEIPSGDRVRGAASYGVVQSLTDWSDPATGRKEVNSNGYPARSCFAVYHILESKVGRLFNKKPTVMELQPDGKGKLALSLPPIPFHYELANGPIPLFDVDEPHGQPVAEIIAAHHRSESAAQEPTPEAWPFREIDLAKIADRIKAFDAS